MELYVLSETVLLTFPLCSIWAISFLQSQYFDPLCQIYGTWQCEIVEKISEIHLLTVACISTEML